MSPVARFRRWWDATFAGPLGRVDDEMRRHVAGSTGFDRKTIVVLVTTAVWTTTQPANPTRVAYNVGNTLAASACGANTNLVVTITTDRHVNKGPGRPVFPEQLRAEMLAGLEIVDHVGISPNPGAEYVIEKIRPDIYLKGSEYSA